MPTLATVLRGALITLQLRAGPKIHAFAAVEKNELTSSMLLTPQNSPSCIKVLLYYPPLLVQFDFTAYVLEKPNIQTPQDEIVWLKLLLSREQYLRQLEQDERDMYLSMFLQTASKASEAQSREEILLTELKKLNMLSAKEREESFEALNISHEKIHRLQQRTKQM
ncbi:hypothetical protein WMY93_019739 [Mugilogobius chulae]|uniref:Uncharacterized protein n=1 Tax=Mugilogobius chulae TaxID=88201 RepID=A0AAW0NS24_9GOBI